MYPRLAAEKEPIWTATDFPGSPKILETSWAICHRLTRPNLELQSRLMISHILHHLITRPTGVIFIQILINPDPGLTTDQDLSWRQMDSPVFS